MKKLPTMDRLAEFVIRRRKPLLATTLLVTAAAAVCALQLRTNDQFVKYFSESIQFRQDADFTMKNLSGIYRLEYQLESGSASGITQPNYLQNLEQFAQWLRAQPEVEHVFSVADILKRVNQVVNGGARGDYRLPATHDATSEALLLYEMNLPSGLDLTDRITIDKSSSRMTVTVKDLSTQEMNAFAARSVAWLKAHAPKPMWGEPSGPVVIFSQLSERNAVAMAKADALSLFLISLCMIVVLRSFKLGILSVIPNIIPIVVGYGLWWLFVGEMNIVATIAASISLGIIVDDTIHFLAKFQTLRRKTRISAEEAMRQTLSHVGPAMLSTGTIIALGFGVLTLSSFRMISHLGWLSLLIVGIAPMVDILIAPALVLMFTVEKKPRRVPQVAAHSASTPLLTVEYGAKS